MGSFHKKSFFDTNQVSPLLDFFKSSLTSFGLLFLFFWSFWKLIIQISIHCVSIVASFRSWNKWEYVLNFSEHVTASFTWPFNCYLATSWLTLGHQWEHMLSQLHLQVEFLNPVQHPISFNLLAFWFDKKKSIKYLTGKV